MAFSTSSQTAVGAAGAAWSRTHLFTRTFLSRPLICPWYNTWRNVYHSNVWYLFFSTTSPVTCYLNRLWLGPKMLRTSDSALQLHMRRHFDIELNEKEARLDNKTEWCPTAASPSASPTKRRNLANGKHFTASLSILQFVENGLLK